MDNTKEPWISILGPPDPRTRPWPLVSESPLYVWLVLAGYFSVVTWGPAFMRHRAPLAIPTWLMVTYNGLNVGLAAYMFVETLLSMLELNHGWMCPTYYLAAHTDPTQLRLTRVLWWFFFSKSLELADTVLMIVRKKTEQLTFLHVFHHSSMLQIWWLVIVYCPGGCAYISCLLNSAVHVLMYTYYALSVVPAIQAWLWWKRYLTQIQIAQFVVLLAHTLQTLRPGCDFPERPKYMLASYLLLLIVLFATFYRKAYTQKRAKAKLAKGIAIDDETHSNGVIYSNGDLKRNGGSKYDRICSEGAILKMRNGHKVLMNGDAQNIALSTSACI